MNTWIYVLVALAALLMMAKPKSKQVSVGNWTSSNFEISPASRDMFYKMQRKEMSAENLKKFAMMEDRFLEYEKDAACRGRDRVLDAEGIHNAIREAFRGYDFAYHNPHLKQVAEPHRRVNPYLSCWKA